MKMKVVVVVRGGVAEVLASEELKKNVDFSIFDIDDMLEENANYQGNIDLIVDQYTKGLVGVVEVMSLSEADRYEKGC